MADVQKTMPHDERPEIERRILGACLLSPELLVPVAARMLPPDFGSGRNRKTFEAMRKLYMENGTFDAARLCRELAAQGIQGAPVYLSGLLDSVEKNIPVEGLVWILTGGRGGG